MSRVDYLNDPHAPRANSLVPGGSAIVVDREERILLIYRTDNDMWSLPSGVMDIGETISDAVVREVHEETGVHVEITGLVGIYSDPRHVIAYSDGEIRQQFNICFRATVVGGAPRASSESREVRFVAPDDLNNLDMHPTQRLRIDHYLQDRPTPYLG